MYYFKNMTKKDTNYIINWLRACHNLSCVSKWRFRSNLYLGTSDTQEHYRTKGHFFLYYVVCNIEKEGSGREFLRWRGWSLKQFYRGLCLIHNTHQTRNIISGWLTLGSCSPSPDDQAQPSRMAELSRDAPCSPALSLSLLCDPNNRSGSRWPGKICN